MDIIVNGKKAVIKNGSTFEYVAENRLFLGRDGYTLTITFPLRDCPENREIFGWINRVDIPKDHITLPCIISDRQVMLQGYVNIVKISEVSVECQFVEGRCAEIGDSPLEDIIIADLDLGEPLLSHSSVSNCPPSDAWRASSEGIQADAVALPWLNIDYPEAPNNWVVYENNAYRWHQDVKKLSWMPYLITIAKRICEAIGYAADFSKWEASPYKWLLICNVLPASWDMLNFADVLPRWSVSEFFYYIELLMHCEFEFDHLNNTVSMEFSSKIINALPEELISDLVDSYTSEMAKETSSNSCQYLGARLLKYADANHQMWPYWSCDWYVNDKTKVVSYDTLEELLLRNKPRHTNESEPGRDTFTYGHSLSDGSRPGLYNSVDEVLYAKDVDTYFVFRYIGYTTKMWGFAFYHYAHLILQPLNIFGCGTPDDTDNAEEIAIVPACITDTFVSNDSDMGMMLQLSLGSMDDVPDEDANDTSDGRYNTRFKYTKSKDSEISFRLPRAARQVEAGEKEKTEYYDTLNIAFWNGTFPENGKSPYPLVDKVSITQDWTAVNTSEIEWSLRLKGRTGELALPRINPTQKFKFSWIASSIPSPRAIFNIRGRRYICEKITATFTENGMSQLLKGEFYPLAED